MSCLCQSCIIEERNKRGGKSGRLISSTEQLRIRLAGWQTLLPVYRLLAKMQRDSTAQRDSAYGAVQARWEAEMRWRTRQACWQTLS